MKFEYFLTHVYGSKVSRRKAMRVAARVGAAAGAASGLAALGASALHDEVAAIGRAGIRRAAPRAYAATLQPEPINDDIFDAAAVERGAWAPGPYGAGDQRGAFNEVTPEKTAAALRLLSPRPRSCV